MSELTLLINIKADPIHRIMYQVCFNIYDISELEQRTQDLRMAENVAMQSIPIIKTMEFSNMNLVRKINSAFILTFTNKSVKKFLTYFLKIFSRKSLTFLLKKV